MSRQNIVIAIFGAIFILAIICSKPVTYRYRNTDNILNKIGWRLYEFQNLNITTSEGIDVHSIQIKKDGKTIFENGKIIDRIGQNYGDNAFQVYVDTLLIAEVCHFKRNNWYANDYEFNVSKDGYNYVVRHRIDGPDSQFRYFQKRYVRKSDYSQLRIDYLNEYDEVYRSEY